MAYEPAGNLIEAYFLASSSSARTELCKKLKLPQIDDTYNSGRKQHHYVIGLRTEPAPCIFQIYSLREGELDRASLGLKCRLQTMPRPKRSIVKQTNSSSPSTSSVGTSTFRHVLIIKKHRSVVVISNKSIQQE